MLAPTTTAVCRARAGLSLLEVLVACGILVLGLTGIAAILPAAASRLGQATQADRGGILAANAHAEVMNSGLAAADLFSSGTRACVFGQGLGLVTTVTVPGSGTASQVLAAATGVLGNRIDTTRGFLLPDDLVYNSNNVSELPLNVFESGSTAQRAFNTGICWGAMLAASGSAGPGVSATLSVAIFRRPTPAFTGLALSGSVGTTTFRLTTGAANGVRDEGTRKQFLGPCSHVLAITRPPQWLRVQSSWTAPGPIVSGTENAAERRSFVVLDRNPMTSGSTLPVIAFDQLLRVDHYPVTLD
jgi:hypothetical protein